MVYAIVSAIWVYGEERNTYAIPLSMGIMTQSQAARITHEDVLEAVQLSLPTAGPDVEIHGLVALKPDSERKGQRFKKKKKKRRSGGSKGDRGAGRRGNRRKGQS